ncbi:MAG: hypothetical protein OXL34_18515 [Gemmatimonadota bacterium]|nr:hypothetical protein [Gemmatimonadota bacterium]
MFVRHAGKRASRRALIACVALLQMGSTAAVTHVDARLDGAQMGLPDHVESPDRTDCPFHHGHLFCQVVRVLAQATVATNITIGDGFAQPVRVVEAAREGDDLQRAPILDGSVVPRGPPVS